MRLFPEYAKASQDAMPHTGRSQCVALPHALRNAYTAASSTCQAPGLMKGTLSHRPALRFWGWGFASEQLAREEEQRLESMVRMLAPGGFRSTAPPRVEEFGHAQATVNVPDSLSALVSTTPYDRLTHAYGKSWADSARMLLRELPAQPLLVGFPRDEQDVNDLLDWATREHIAVVPFGGGSSVCGGVEAVGRSRIAPCSRSTCST